MSNAPLMRGGSTHGPWPWQRYDVLWTLYIEDDLTRAEVAEKLGCSKETIDEWLARHEIRKRDR